MNIELDSLNRWVNIKNISEKLWNFIEIRLEVQHKNIAVSDETLKIPPNVSRCGEKEEKKWANTGEPNVNKKTSKELELLKFCVLFFILF